MCVEQLHAIYIPFTIGIQTAWQHEMMLKHGHKKAVSIDATFVTNENKVWSHCSPLQCMLQLIGAKFIAVMDVTTMLFVTLQVFP